MGRWQLARRPASGAQAPQAGKPLEAPTRDSPASFEALEKLEPLPDVEPPVRDETSPVARAGLSPHAGLTNGNGPKLAPTAGAADAAANRATRSRRPFFGRPSRSADREGPGFQRASGLTNGGGLTNGAGLVNGRGRVNGGRVNGGQVNGGRVNGGRVNGGRVNGGRVNGGRVNGGRVNGGRVNGSPFGNGAGLLYAHALHQRRRVLARRTAALLAVLLFLVLIFGPLAYTNLFAPPPVIIDGDFGDWAPVLMVPDAVDDQTLNGDINLVAFASVQSDRDLFLYVQVPQGFHPFEGPNPAGAESFRVLVDSDRSSATGYLAFGLGVDYVLELSGYGGTLHASTLSVYPQGSPDRTDSAFFASLGAVRAIAVANQLEASVPLSSIATHGRLPFLLLLSQDSLGRFDVGDAVFSSAPGLLALRQSPTPLGTLPTDRDVLLLSVEARAYHQNLTLQALLLTVDGEGGAGVRLSYVLAAGRNLSVGVNAPIASTVRVPLGGAGPLALAPSDGLQVIEVWGRATGPAAGGTLRLFVAGSQDVQTAPPPAGRSGHGSILPPNVFERSYVGAAPAAVRIDGAFADWLPTRPFDNDPDDDVTGPLASPSPGGPNPPAANDQDIDNRQARADVNTGALLVSFYLEVDGSILAGKRLEPPSYPRPTPGGPSGSAPGEPAANLDIASIYVDTDSNTLTGWRALPGIGIDAVLQIKGKGGGYGRIPFVTETSRWAWDPSAQRFNQTAVPLPVGLGSSKLETQTPAADLCGTSCGAVRYAFFLQDTDGNADVTSAFDGNFRGSSDALYFSEGPARTRNAYPGDLHVPLLAFSVDAGPGNVRDATLTGFVARITGVAPADVTAVEIFADGGTLGVLEPDELRAGPLAAGTLAANGYVQLAPATAPQLAPGAALRGLLAASIAPDAATPAWLNATVASVQGLRTTGVLDVQYTASAPPPSVRLLGGAPGSRGQNNLVINEVNTVGGWVEVFDTTGLSTNLSAPSRMGLEVYRTNNNGANFQSLAIIVFSGTTNSEGFAVFNYSVPYTTPIRKYFVAIWCSNCTAGQDIRGRNNQTYVDFVQMPFSTAQGAWGRYPDGNASFRNTTNDTRNDNNKLPLSDPAPQPSSQNNLVVNEVSFVGNWVEVYSTTAGVVSLTSPSTMGLELYHTSSNGANFQTDAILVLTGSTNAEGFAAFNLSVPYSTTIRNYHVALWCSNCTAGQDSQGRDNRSYLDDVLLPSGTALGAWGRYPDGNGSFFNTTNNTRADNNIPEFSQLALPSLGLLVTTAALRRRIARPRP
jgi:hypothetical protein